jgi:hypothetical protein
LYRYVTGKDLPVIAGYHDVPVLVDAFHQARPVRGSLASVGEVNINNVSRAFQ